MLRNCILLALILRDARFARKELANSKTAVTPVYHSMTPLVHGEQAAPPHFHEKFLLGGEFRRTR
jgi:hypothetical protein